MARAIEHRLQRLEAQAKDSPLRIIVRWAEDGDNPGDGPVIRLQWGDAHEPREAPETA
jgi:hypothetical protein